MSVACVSLKPFLSSRYLGSFYTCNRYLSKLRRGKRHDEARSYKDRIEEIKAIQEKDIIRNNIGFPLKKFKAPPESEWAKLRQQHEQVARFKKLELDLETVRENWLEENGPEHTQTVAEHYGIYRDLFNNSFFYPKLFMDIDYDLDDDFVMPFYLGNKITPTEAQTAPNVAYKSDPDKQWTLVMSSPDGHLQDNEAECLHWLIGNIPGNDISNGEILCEYLPPFPPRGTGLLRYIFVLYEQNGKIDYSDFKKPSSSVSLSGRTFSTLDFYGQRQEELTPAALSFFQAEWDPSVQTFFRETLDMKEPVFEFMYPPNYHPKQRKYPHKQPFNLYLDRYRDVKDIQEEVLKERLKKVFPLQPPAVENEYPLAEVRGKSSWQRLRDKHIILKRHQWKDL